MKAELHFELFDRQEKRQEDAVKRQDTQISREDKQWHTPNETKTIRPGQLDYA